MPNEEKQQYDRPKTFTELFFQWLSDFTLPIVKDKYGLRITAATIGIVVGSWAIAQNADSITKIINIFK